jgi:proteasome lid subunit RPN8/RPN11
MNEQTLQDTLQRVRTYLLEDAEVERGCMLDKEGNIHPFQNHSSHPQAHIQMGPDAFKILCKLAAADNLFAWVHSHPKWAPIPSITDIQMHDMPCKMIIYGVPEDRFAVYENDEIIEKKKELEAYTHGN